MSIGQHGVGSDLVAGLIDARDMPAADRFDAELRAAVEAGEVTPEAAKRLKLWQRAAVSELADHIRAVLPTALSALADARDQAQRRVQESEWAARSQAEGTPTHPVVEPAVEAARDTPEAASGPGPAAPTSLEGRPARMMVADLVVTRTPAHHDPS
jgi:hypothetical protein